MKPPARAAGGFPVWIVRLRIADGMIRRACPAALCRGPARRTATARYRLRMLRKELAFRLKHPNGKLTERVGVSGVLRHPLW